MGNDTDLNNLAMSEDARPLLDALAKHIRENVDVFGFQLSDDEMTKLSNIQQARAA